MWGCVALVLSATQAQATGVRSRKELQSAQSQVSYFEQGIQRIEYYGAQLAILHYREGSKLRLGLVEPYIEAPVQSVDCHVQQGDLVAIEDPEMGLGFVTYAELVAQGAQHPGAHYSEHARRVMRPIELHEMGGRIVPNHINPMTAPSLCRVLDELEAEFVSRCDAMAAASVGALESTALVLELALIKEGIRTPKPAAGTVVARTAGRLAARGLGNEAAEAALAGMRSGGGHAIRHIISEGIISDTGTLASRMDAFRRIALPILTRPLGRPFAWRIGETQATGFLGRTAGRWIAVLVAEDGPWAGKVVAGLVPDPNQLALMLGRAGLGGL